jgi:hypothetical protein
VKIGFLEIGPLKAGAFRHLTPGELTRFRKVLKMDQESLHGEHTRTA